MTGITEKDTRYMLQNLEPLKMGKLGLNYRKLHRMNRSAFLKMPVPVRVYNSDKTDSMDFRLINNQNDQQFILDTDFKVASFDN